MRASLSIEIDASCETVFDLIHDYDRRLEWDSMLREARLLDGAETADINVRSRCVGTWKSAFLPMETIYVSFEHGKVAAVKLINTPPFFSQFAATLRHQPLNQTQSRVTYIYHFRARPRWLAPLLEPIMNLFLQREVRNRLAALKLFLETVAKT